MARDYILKDGSSEDDVLPMHRTAGDTVSFPYNDKMLYGMVVAVKDPLTCLIEADGEMYFERGQEVIRLEDSDRCPECGGFIVRKH